MAQGETPITIIGNIVAEPELRYTPSGKAVANFRIASTPRAFNRDSGKWEDQDALFLTCTAWNDMATNVMDTMSKGTRAIVHGVLEQRNYETRSGEKRSAYEIRVEDCGPSLKFATATVNRTPRDGGGNTGGGNWGGNTGGGGNWKSGPDTENTGKGFPPADEPPF